ncbi:MAG: hypothetical protein ABSH24_05730 [Bryobacteraceae bacterium]
MPSKCNKVKRTDKLRSVLAAAAGVALFAWFLFVVRGGLASWFDNDDLMNLNTYWTSTWPALLKANLAFWSSYYRPAGGLFYQTIFALWGFHPLPFRIAVLALLSVNFALLAVVVWQLTRSCWSVLIALLLLGTSPAFGSAYFDTGNIYDILAYAFFWGAFALYVHFREAGRLTGWGGLALVFCLFVGALNAKEISVSFPVAVGLYELVWHPPANWKLVELWRWIRQEGRFAVIGGLADIAYIIGKRYGPNSLWQIEPYRPHYSVAAYFLSLAHYLAQLIYYPVTISSWQIAGLLAAMLAGAAVIRRRCLLWGLGFIAVSVLPLAFIPGRSGSGYLVPSVGWAVYAGGLLDWLVKSLTGRRAWLRIGVQALLLAAILALITPWQRRCIQMQAKAAHQMQGRFRNYIEQIHAAIPAPRKGARILLLSDADGRDDWDVYFLIRLYYGDPKLYVARMSVWRAQHAHLDPGSYDYVLDWVHHRFVLVDNKLPRIDSDRQPVAIARAELLLVQPGIYDDFDPAIGFSGPWIRDKAWPRTHAHTVTYCDMPGSEIRLAFQGGLLTYVYTKAANRGKADITIDGIHRATLDLYSRITKWQSRTTFKMGAGRHLALITVLPDKNPKSSNRFVDVDAFEVQ